MIEYVYNVRMIPTFIDFTSFFNALRIVLWVCGLEYQINNVYYAKKSQPQIVTLPEFKLPASSLISGDNRPGRVLLLQQQLRGSYYYTDYCSSASLINTTAQYMYHIAASQCPTLICITFAVSPQSF